MDFTREDAIELLKYLVKNPDKGALVEALAAKAGLWGEGKAKESPVPMARPTLALAPAPSQRQLRLAKTLAEVKAAACEVLGISEEQLDSHVAGRHIQRGIVWMLVQKHTGASLAEMKQVVGHAMGTIANWANRARYKAKTDAAFADLVDEIKASLDSGHEAAQEAELLDAAE